MEIYLVTIRARHLLKKDFDILDNIEPITVTRRRKIVELLLKTDGITPHQMTKEVGCNIGWYITQLRREEKITTECPRCHNGTLYRLVKKENKK